MENKFSILDVSGPYREPREQVFSYDYAIQRPSWPTAHGVRIKVSIPHELDHFKDVILGIAPKSPGQQLIASRLLSRRIADRKLEIADEAGMFSARLDVLVEPFVGPLTHLFTKLEAWMKDSQDAIRKEVQERTGG